MYDLRIAPVFTSRSFIAANFSIGRNKRIKPRKSISSPLYKFIFGNLSVKSSLKISNPLRKYFFAVLNCKKFKDTYNTGNLAYIHKRMTHREYILCTRRQWIRYLGSNGNLSLINTSWFSVEHQCSRDCLRFVVPVLELGGKIIAYRKI